MIHVQEKLQESVMSILNLLAPNLRNSSQVADLHNKYKTSQAIGQLKELCKNKFRIKMRLSNEEM